MFRAIVFFGLITLAFAGATLDALVNAAARFSIAIKQQLEVPASSPSPTEFAGKTIAYAEAKTTYFTAMRSAIPELINIATRREAEDQKLLNYGSGRTGRKDRSGAAAQCRSRSSFLVWLIRNDKKESAKWPIEPEPRKFVEIPPAEEPPVAKQFIRRLLANTSDGQTEDLYKVEVILGCGDFGDYVGCNVDKRGYRSREE